MYVILNLEELRKVSIHNRTWAVQNRQANQSKMRLHSFIFSTNQSITMATTDLKKAFEDFSKSSGKRIYTSSFKGGRSHSIKLTDNLNIRCVERPESIKLSLVKTLEKSYNGSQLIRYSDKNTMIIYQTQDGKDFNFEVKSFSPELLIVYPHELENDLKICFENIQQMGFVSKDLSPQRDGYFRAIYKVDYKFAHEIPLELSKYISDKRILDYFSQNETL